MPIRLFLLISSLLLTACSTPKSPETIFELPKPLREPLATPEENFTLPEQDASDSQTSPPASKKPRFYATPTVPSFAGVQPAGKAEEVLPNLGQAPMKINVESLPLPAFINEIFGNLLGLSFEIHPNLQKQKDLVTLRVNDPQTPKELYNLSRQVLDNYGVSILKQGDLLRFVPSGKAGGGEPPLLVTGSTLPSVPVTHRPIFQFVPLEIVRNVHVKRWIRDIFEKQGLEVDEDLYRNAVILRGPQNLVQQAVEMIKLLDKPLMRGQHSLRIEPLYLKPQELGGRLSTVLKSEGFEVGQRSTDADPILLLAIEPLNSLFVFSTAKSVLQHIKDWVVQLDQPSQLEDKAKQNLFFYAVQNTTATSLNDILKNLLQMTANQPPQAGANQNNLVVDETRNTLLFYGKQEIWHQLLPIIQQLDQPSRQVLIEVLVAEITLSNDQEFGIEWLVRNAGIGDFEGDLGTLGSERGGQGSGLGVGGSGLNYFPMSNSGQTLAVLNAFASSNRIQVLSRPTIMVRSGEDATIDVGREVPIITSQGTSADLQTNQQGSSAILQQIQYRKTGVLLQVKPVIYSNNRIDLEVTQESSEAQPNTLSSIESPVISNRRITTSLTLADGGSVLLGGLISSSRTQGEAGVPGLKDIPILGHLFKTNKNSRERSELIMLIIPYILNDNRQTEKITEAFQTQLELLSPVSESVVLPEKPVNQ